MGIDSIGKKIAELRKARGITQDELARHVGVSAQAVSKWENGGVPDTELLPKIAEFFQVSIDSLFARGGNDSVYIRNVLMEYLAEVKPSERMERVFDICWDMERVLVMGEKNTWGGTVADMQLSIGEGNQSNSTMMCDYGFTRMGIGTLSKYFLIVPEAEDKKAAYVDGVDYAGFFRELSDSTFLNALLMLYQREHGKAFTDELLVHSMGITEEKAAEIMALLHKYKLLRTTEIELEDSVQQVFHFAPSPSFVALLIFAKEMIAPSHHHTFRYRGRQKPYLK